MVWGAYVNCLVIHRKSNFILGGFVKIFWDLWKFHSKMGKNYRAENSCAT